MASSKFRTTLIGTLIIGALLRTMVPFPVSMLVYFLGLVVLGTILGLIASHQERVRSLLPSKGFLCDRCKYNDVRYCSRPERPNATSCPDFKS